MAQIDQSDLRDFIVHFKDGRTIQLRAARFKAHYRNATYNSFSFSLDIALEKGKDTKACIYVKPDEVAAIIPVYPEGYDDQIFKVTLKSGTTIEVQAGAFRVSPIDTIEFFGIDGTYQPNVFVLTSEVLACVPVGSVPEAMPPIEVRSK
jgi:hypothetical protein